MKNDIVDSRPAGRRFFFSDEGSDWIATEMEKHGFARVCDFQDLKSKLQESGVSDGIEFGFVFKSDGKGVPSNLEHFVAGLVPLFDDCKFDYLFAVSHGSKAKFNLYVLESVLMNFGACLSYMKAVRDLNEAGTIADDVSNGKISLISRPLFYRRYVKQSEGRINAELESAKL